MAIFHMRDKTLKRDPTTAEAELTICQLLKGSPLTSGLDVWSKYWENMDLNVILLPMKLTKAFNGFQFLSLWV